MKKALIMGINGNVGSELKAQASKEGYECIAGSRDTTQYLLLLPTVDAVFIAITNTAPNEECGNPEFWLLSRAMEAGKPVVTAAKAAQAFQFGKLKPDMSRFGGMASVGGGSRQTEIIDPAGDDKLAHLFAIQNACINLACWGTQNGTNEEELFRMMQRLKMLEKGSGEFMSAIRIEILDALWKTAISFNRSSVGRTVSPLSFVQARASDAELREFLKQPGTRLVTEIVHGPRQCMPGDVFWCRSDEWNIAGTFRDDAPLLFDGLDISGEMNAAIAHRSHSGIHTRNDKGAGAHITAKTMLYDMQKLLEKKAY